MTPESIKLADSVGWLPYRIRQDNARLLVDWCRFDGRLEEPFFDQSIQQMLRRDPQASCTTPIEALQDAASDNAPSGFVFHISRCGSTLISRMLSSAPELAVFSEPAILDAVLRGEFRSGAVSDEEAVDLLRVLIGAFIGHGAGKRGTVIKFTARAILDYPLIVRAYPDVPCVLAYRDPIEVLVSLAGGRSNRLPPGLAEARLLRGEPQATTVRRPAEFWARVLAGQLAAAVEMCECARPLLVEYGQLPQVVWTDIARFFGVALCAADKERMRQVSARNAKDAGSVFSDDRPAKRAAATEEMLALAGQLLRPYYDRLETMRCSTSHDE